MKNKKILNAIFCIESTNLTIHEVFSSKYDDIFLLHTGLTSREALHSLSSSDLNDVLVFIEDTNFINS